MASTVSPIGLPARTGEKVADPGVDFSSLLRLSDVVDSLDSLTVADVEAISTRSYLHNNGFLKVVLRDYPDGSALRLHVWMNPEEESDIHSHRWPFMSRVLSGQVEQALFSVTDGGESLRYSHSSRKHGTGYSLTPVGQATAALNARFTMEPGFTYTLSPAAYHSVTITRPLTATLVLTWPAETNETFILPRQELDVEWRAVRLSTDKIIQLRETLRSKVSSEVPSLASQE
jgi:hypothetical protein